MSRQVTYKFIYAATNLGKLFNNSNSFDIIFVSKYLSISNSSHSLKTFNTSLLLSLTFTLKIVKSVIFPLKMLDTKMSVL